jgi:hypothetical protein
MAKLARTAAGPSPRSNLAHDAAARGRGKETSRRSPSPSLRAERCTLVRVQPFRRGPRTDCRRRSSWRRTSAPHQSPFRTQRRHERADARTAYRSGGRDNSRARTPDRRFPAALPRIVCAGGAARPLSLQLTQSEASCPPVFPLSPLATSCYTFSNGKNSHFQIRNEAHGIILTNRCRFVQR